MKKIFSIVAAFIALTAAVSCQKENFGGKTTNLIPLTITVGGEKTTLVEGTDIVFNAGDEIAVFDGTAVQKFVTVEGGAEAVFEGSVTQGATDLWAVYPYYEKLKLDEDGKIITVIPRVQYADQPGSFGSKANVSVGKATVEQPTFAMKNATSLMKITISQENIDSVMVTGINNEKISGVVEVTLPEGETSMKVIAGEVPSTSKEDIIRNEVILKAADGGHIAPGTYYLALRPADLAGVRYLFYGNEGKGALRCSTESVSLHRAKSRDFKTIDGGLVWKNFTRWNIRFKKLVALWENETKNSNWPFSETNKGTSKEHAKSATLTSASYGYQLLPLQEIAGEGNVFEYYVNSQNGMFFYPKSSTEPYIQFPVIEGMKLISVGFSGGSSNMGTPSFVAADGSEFYGGGEQSPRPFSLVRWDFSGTKADVAYQMISGKSSTWTVSQILLTYLGNKPATLASVTTNGASNVEGTTATINGTVVGDVQDPANDIECGFYYRVKDSGEYAKVTCTTPAMTFSYDLAGLTAGTTYEYYAYAKPVAGAEVTGEVEEFKTASASDLTITLTPSDFKDAGMPEVKAFPTTDQTTQPPTSYTYNVKGYDFTCNANVGELSSGGKKYYITFNCYNTKYLITGKTAVNMSLPIGAAVGGRTLKSLKLSALPGSGKTITLSVKTKNAEGAFGDALVSYSFSAEGSCELTLPAEAKNKDNYYISVGNSSAKWMINELVYEYSE